VRDLMELFKRNTGGIEITMDDLRAAMESLGGAIEAVVDKIKEIVTAIGNALVLRRRSIIVKYCDKGRISDLIRKYSFFGRRLRVRERICDSSVGGYGRWKLYFYMTDDQFRSLMTKIIVRKFDWKLEEFRQREVGKAFKHSKLGGGSGAKIYDIKKRRR